MPQIPVFSESQVLDPSSPVAIGSADISQYEASNKLGAALVDLGNKLDTVEKIKADRVKQKDAATAVEQFRSLVSHQSEQVLYRQDQQGVDGIEARKTITDFATNLQKQFLDTNDFDKEQTATFTLGSMKVLNDMEPDIRRVSAEVGTKAYNNSIARNLQQVGTNVANDPRLLAESLANVHMDVLNDPDIVTPLMKDQAINDRSKFLVRAAVGKMADNADFDTAHAVLESNMGLFPDKEMDAERRNLNEAKNTYYSQDFQRYSRTDRLNKDRIEKGDIAARDFYGKMMIDAGNDQDKINAVIKQINLDPNLKPESAKALEDRINVNKNYKDDDYERQALTKVFKTGNFDQMVSDVNRDFGAGLISDSRAADLIKKAESLKDHNRSDPTLLKLIDQKRGEIDSFKKPPTWDPVQSIYKSENDTANERVQSDFMSRVARLSQQGKLSVDSINGAASAAMRTLPSGGPAPQPVTGIPSGRLDTVEHIDAQAKEIVTDFTLNGKTWSKKKKDAVTKQLNDLGRTRKQVEAQEWTKRQSFTPSAPSKKSFDE